MGDPRVKRQIEERYDEPIETILLRELNALGSITQVARKLNVSEQNLFKWTQKLNIQKEIRWYKR